MPLYIDIIFLVFSIIIIVVLLVVIYKMSCNILDALFVEDVEGEVNEALEET